MTGLIFFMDVRDLIILLCPLRKDLPLSQGSQYQAKYWFEVCALNSIHSSGTITDLVVTQGACTASRSF